MVSQAGLDRLCHPIPGEIPSPNQTALSKSVTKIILMKGSQALNQTLGAAWIEVSNGILPDFGKRATLACQNGCS